MKYQNNQTFTLICKILLIILTIIVIWSIYGYHKIKNQYRNLYLEYSQLQSEYKTTKEELRKLGRF